MQVDSLITCSQCLRVQMKKCQKNFPLVDLPLCTEESRDPCKITCRRRFSQIIVAQRQGCRHGPKTAWWWC